MKSLSQTMTSADERDDVQPRALYFQQAQLDPTIIAQRDIMTRCYLSDVKSLKTISASNSIIPRHTALSTQNSDGCSIIKLRIAQWNVNVLHGPDMKSPVSAQEAAETINDLNADVVLIQEGGIQDFETCTSDLFQGLDSSIRILEFHECLKNLGFKLCVAEGVPNPAMLATRLDIVQELECFGLDSGGETWPSFYEKMIEIPGRETRNGRYVILSLQGSKANLENGISLTKDSIAGHNHIAVCISHLHHDERNLRGLRKCEIRSILKHKPSNLQVAGTIIATDFNQARKGDYNRREWAIITKGLDVVDQPHSDGVHEELMSHDFVCTYDCLSETNRTNLDFTHWTSTIVDFAYLQFSNPAAWSVENVCIVPCPLSDHLPVVHDININLALL